MQKHYDEASQVYQSLPHADLRAYSCDGRQWIRKMDWTKGRAYIIAWLRKFQWALFKKKGDTKGQKVDASIFKGIKFKFWQQPVWWH